MYKLSRAGKEEPLSPSPSLKTCAMIASAHTAVLSEGLHDGADCDVTTMMHVTALPLSYSKAPVSHSRSAASLTFAMLTSRTIEVLSLYHSA